MDMYYEEYCEYCEYLGIQPSSYEDWLYYEGGQVVPVLSQVQQDQQ